MRRVSQFFLVVPLLLIFFAICCLFGKPYYSPYTNPPNSTPVLLPLLLFSYNGFNLISTLALGGILLGVWLILEPEKVNRWPRFLALPFVIGIPLCSCCLLSTKGNDELDYFNLASELPAVASLTVGDHVYYFVLSKGYTGFGGGFLFECDSAGLICRAVVGEPWGAEGRYDSSAAVYHLQSDGSSVLMMFEDEVLAEYVIGTE